MFDDQPWPIDDAQVLVSRLAKAATACLLGAAALAWIAAHSGPRSGTVVVHVAEADVDVGVGPISFSIAGRRLAPLVCELPAGGHSLTMLRRGTLLYREDFDVIAGDEVVLTAFSNPNPDAVNQVARPDEGPDPLARVLGPQERGPGSPHR